MQFERIPLKRIVARFSANVAIRQLKIITKLWHIAYILSFKNIRLHICLKAVKIYSKC